MALPSYAMNQTSFPEMYERQLVGPLFRPWAEMTLDEVAVSSGERILDLACGTGIMARLAKQRAGASARVVGVDISPDMLAVARTVEPGIDWRVGDVAALPLAAEEQFDVVVCQQGLQFFPDKAAAAAQMRRALAPGGRLAVSTWRSDNEIPFFLELRRVAEGHLGPIADQRYSFGDAAALEVLLHDAGFHEVRSRTVSRTIFFEDGAPFLRMNAMALVGMSAGGMALSNEQRQGMVATIAEESIPVLRAYRDGPGIAFELVSNLATGTV